MKLKEEQVLTPYGFCLFKLLLRSTKRSSRSNRKNGRKKTPSALRLKRKFVYIRCLMLISKAFAKKLGEKDHELKSLQHQKDTELASLQQKCTKTEKSLKDDLELKVKQIALLTERHAAEVSSIIRLPYFLTSLSSYEEKTN